jgi:thiol-disulfide isomerase/thioredoxin
MPRVLKIFVFVVVLVVAAVFGFVVRQAKESTVSTLVDGGQTGSQTPNEVLELSGQKFERWAKPRDVPDLQFSDPAGRPTSLSKFRGRMVLLNLWATWCPPCREEMPALDRLNARLGGDRFTVVTLALDSPAKADAFLRQIKATTLQNYTDTQGLALSMLGVTTVPTTLLIDAQGREIGRLSGAAAWDEKPALDLIQSLLKESP